MQTYICLLRAINLGSHNRISMPELKAGLEKMDAERVSTYLQSGNTVFKSSQKNSSSLSQAVQEMIKKEFGHEITVISKTALEMQRVANENPFLQENLNPAFLHVTFLAEIPLAAKVAALPAGLGGEDQWRLHKDVIYLYCPDGYGKSKLNNMFFERKLKATATTRNWKTVTALNELANSL